MARKFPGLTWRELCGRTLLRAPLAGFRARPFARFPHRAIAKRHAMTGSGLGRYAETRPAPGFRRG